MRQSLMRIVALAAAVPDIVPAALAAASPVAANPQPVVSTSGTASVQVDAARLAQAPAEPPKTAEPAEKSAAAEEPQSGVKLGLEYYFGLTNYTGRDRRSTDGVWAGAQTFYPSNVSLNWSRGESAAARLSLGIGDMYAGPHRTMEQPVEAWYQTRVGGCQLTAGKYYTPFALQEWQWEPKYGMMIARSVGHSSYSASLQYNTRLNRPNVYLRAGRQLGKKTTVGVSGAVGRGLSYNSSHDVALGADLTQEFAATQFVSEYVFADGPNGTSSTSS